MNALAAPPRNGELGFWVAQLADRKPSFPRFTGQDFVDVAIVGGGYTGLWAAYFAKKLEPSLSVAVFEAEQIGYGASGRNGGWLSAMPPGNRATFARAGGGLEASRALQQEFVAGVDAVLDILEAEGIDADQHKGGALVAAHTRAGLGRLVTRRDADLKYGLTDDEVHLFDRDEFQSRINISTVHGGLFYKHCARIHPAKLVYGLADTLTSMGVSIYEGSRVDSVGGEDPHPGRRACHRGEDVHLHRRLFGAAAGSPEPDPGQFIDDRDQAPARGGVAADRLGRAPVPQRLRSHVHLLPADVGRPYRHGGAVVSPTSSGPARGEPVRPPSPPST
ncbi:glycine/D-amino acid oxidase-like deaminating enzyme [Streptomyces luteogriseus]|uniref:Glycine/D-amino acid oxidase-like deaminating enzyme n=1 Tax=Streptomyces luteogriseus TaxID=68233 RepID=A0A7W7DH78_9ACTN|nr:FAD-dependent oxidoreductase [Streptomyces luteogriseus]MBB4710753.1 glycine/D-amino acid oxidase-like deaminating enzyme [Streptomyces luteogriseus]